MKQLRGGSLAAEQSLFQAMGGGSIPTSPHNLELREIRKELAELCYEKWHYLGKKGFMASYNIGVFWGGRLWGCVSFGGISAEETIQGLFGTTKQDGFFEIKRLALSDDLPQNSESRIIAIAIKLLRKIKTVKAIITYADTAVGHTGVIYRASGFQYKGLTAQKSDFWVNGKIQERGKTRGIKGEWRPRSRKHLFVKQFI